MAEKKYSEGDLVSLARWDCYERPPNKLGQCIITDVYKAQCESGWLCDVKSIDYDGRSKSGLDQNWLIMISPFSANKPAVAQDSGPEIPSEA